MEFCNLQPANIGFFNFLQSNTSDFIKNFKQNNDLYELMKYAKDISRDIKLFNPDNKRFTVGT